MAALNRPTNATYETHENVTIDTQDNEDHTFWWVKEWYRIVSHYWNITRYAFHDVTLYCVQKALFLSDRKSVTPLFDDGCCAKH